MKYSYNRNSKKSRYRLWCFLVVIATTLAVAGVAAAKFYMDNFSDSGSQTPQLSQKTSGNPQFTFDTAAAPGWYQGPVDKVSMALFSEDRESGCWASIEVRPGSVDAVTELNKIQNSLVSGGNTVTTDGTIPLTLQTTTEKIPYELHKYTVTGDGSVSKPYGAQEFAYFALGQGHAKVQGYCNTADKLQTITPALQAVKFDPAK
jgi:hypothetical protein